MRHVSVNAPAGQVPVRYCQIDQEKLFAARQSGRDRSPSQGTILFVVQHLLKRNNLAGRIAGGHFVEQERSVGNLSECDLRIECDEEQAGPGLIFLARIEKSRVHHHRRGQHKLGETRKLHFNPYRRGQTSDEPRASTQDPRRLLNLAGHEIKVLLANARSHLSTRCGR
jgi:hypothetical protein